jgi:hypothetical protein
MLKQSKILLGSALIVFASLAHTQSADSKDTASPVPSVTTATPAAKQAYQSSADSRKEKRQAKRQARQEQRAKKKAAKEEYKAKERAAKEEQKP